MAKKQRKTAGNTPADQSGDLSGPVDKAEAVFEEDGSLSDGDTWHKPFYLRYRLYTIAGVILSAAWLKGAYHYVENMLGWANLGELLPHEVGGIAAGAFTPLALLWMVIAFWERGQSLKHDTAALRWHRRSRCPFSPGR